MYTRLFVHFPVCSGPNHRNEWLKTIKRNPALQIYSEYVDITNLEHSKKIVARIEGLKHLVGFGTYPLYALLYLVSRWKLPPSPRAILRHITFQEDRIRLAYHTDEISGCNAGVFIPTDEGKWTFDMWRNASKMLKQGKRIYVLVKDDNGGWFMAEKISTPTRADRLNRRKTFHELGVYAEFKKPPNLYTFLRDAFKNEKH